MQRDPTYLDRMKEYIKRNLKKGYNKDSLKWALVKQGHSKLEIEKAIKMAEQEVARDDEVERRRVVAEQPKPEIVPIVEEKKSFWQKLFGS